MNAAHLHLVLNHIPLIGIGFVLLLLVIALVRRNREVINIALIFTVMVALFAIPVYLTGEPAEELVEDLPGVSESIMEEHEESAEISFILIEITGPIALISLIAMGYSENYGRKLSILTLLLLIVSGGSMIWTANLGGKIHHPEIRSDTLYPSSTADMHDEREDNEEDED